MEYAREGSGPCLVLLPGLGCDRRMWQPVGGLLRDRYALLYPNPWPLSSLPETAARVVDLLDRLRLRSVGLVGLSLGGYIAFEILRRRSEPIRAVAFVDTTAFPDTAERIAKRWQVLRLLEQGRFEAVLDAFIASVIAMPEAGGESARRTLLSMARDLGAESFARATRAMLGRGGYEDVLDALRLPTLFLVGERDTLTPPEIGARMAARVAGARCQTVPGAGHMTPLEQPEAVASALDTFFRGTLATSD